MGSHRWEGHGEIKPVRVTPRGKRAIKIEGSGPSKQAIFQKVRLPACHYRLSAIVAGSYLRPNQWQQSAAIYISLEGQETIFQEIFSGNQDWKKISLTFEVKSSTKGHVYFFNYGGGALFVDQISLQNTKNCAGPKLKFTVAKKPIAKLNYQPPLKRADLALLGYCSHKTFSRRPVCKKLRGADLSKLQPVNVRASKSRHIADFSKSHPFDQDGWQLVDRSQGGKAARLQVGQYMVATPEKGLVSDWSGLNWLSFSVTNPSPKPQKLYVEIHDAQSTGYWSRVNYYTMAPPGTTRLQIPLQVFVGEKSVIQERRRLDLHHITKLVFSGQEATIPIDLFDIGLDPEPPFKNDFATLIKLDSGPPGSPLFTGFTALRPQHAYRPERGYGYSADANLARSEDRRHPDNLLRDWSSLTKGGLDFDLPNGRYHVWMMLEDPGYWEYYPNFEARQVKAEGKTVLDETMNADQFLKKFYRHANDEDLPGDDIWKRYIPPRYKPLTFRVNVTDGQLNLRFDSHDNPYALALSALIIYPEREKQRGQAFIKEVWQKLQQQYNREYRQIAPPASTKTDLPGNALDGALSIFSRSSSIDVHSYEAPLKGELTKRLDLALSRGETAALTLSLRANNTLQLENVQLDLPGLNATGFKVRNKITRLAQDGTVYWNAPRLLDPLQKALRNTITLPKGTVRRLWFDVKAPAKIKKDNIKGTLRLSFKGGQKITLPVRVAIHPWTLPAANVFNGYLGSAPNYPGNPWSKVAKKARTEMRASLDLLSSHSMNRISGGLGGPVFEGYESGRVKINFEKADQSMSLISRHTNGPVESYSGMSIQDLSVYRPDEGAAENHNKPYSRILGDVLRAIKKHGKQHNWPKISHVVGDEPDGDAIAQSIAAAKAFRATRTGAKTSIFTSITNRTGDTERLKFAGLIDLIYLNSHSETALRAIRAKGSDCALYNKRSRYERGIYLFKLKKLGCKGHMQFAFNSTHIDHWYDLDGREDDQVAVFTHPDGELRQALDLKRYRQAITDYRYVLKLEHSIAKSRNIAAKKSAQAWLTALLGKMKIGHERVPPFTPVQLDGVRAKAAALINQL